MDGAPENVTGPPILGRPKEQGENACSALRAFHPSDAEWIPSEIWHLAMCAVGDTRTFGQ